MKKLLSLVGLLLIMATPLWATEPTDVIGSLAYESSHVLRSGLNSLLFKLTVNYHTAAYRTIMLFDTDVVPANGSVTACAPGVANHQKGCLAWCIEGDATTLAQTESFSTKDFTETGMPFQWGVTVVASTSTSGCASLTADSANEWFNALVNP